MYTYQGCRKVWKSEGGGGASSNRRPFNGTYFVNIPAKALGIEIQFKRTYLGNQNGSLRHFYKIWVNLQTWYQENALKYLKITIFDRAYLKINIFFGYLSW